MITLNCKRESSFDNYNLTIAYVYDVQKVHWGKGFYNLTVHYEYEVEGVINKGKFEPEGKVRSYSGKWIIGDSVLIKYNTDNIRESKYIRRSYSKPRIK